MPRYPEYEDEWPPEVVSAATHCKYGHRMEGSNIYMRPDGKGRQCKACCKRRQLKEPVPPTITYTHCVNGHAYAEVGFVTGRPNNCRRCHNRIGPRANAARRRKVSQERALRLQLETAAERNSDGSLVYCKKGLHCLDDPANFSWVSNRKGRYRRCRICFNVARRVRRVLRRQLVLQAYGAKCVCCSEDWPDFLHLDHINSDGAAHRRELGGEANGGRFNIGEWAILNNFPDRLQLLCANCNLSKEHAGCPSTHLGREKAGTLGRQSEWDRDEIDRLMTVGTNER